MKTTFLFVAVTVGMTAIMVSGATAALISPGFDLYQTQSATASFAFMPLEADFFGPGSNPFNGGASLTGQTMGPGNTDVIVQRTGSLADGVDGEIPFEIVALHLVSVQPITVTYASGPPQLWDLEITIPAAPPQPNTGIMNVSHGGTFNGNLSVRPLFVFSEVGNPTNQRTIEPSDELLFTEIEGIAVPVWSDTAAPLDAHNGTYPAGGFYVQGTGTFLGFFPFVSADGEILDLTLSPAVVPEPSSIVLSGISLVGLVAFARRRRRR